MVTWGSIVGSTSRDTEDMIEEVIKLRVALTERWVNNERLIAFLDSNRDGSIDYDEFYDGLSQFGLTDSINVEKVFAYIDKEKVGSIPAAALVDALRLKEEDLPKGSSDHDDEDDLLPFPETLLVGLVAHNNMKVRSFRHYSLFSYYLLEGEGFF